MKKAFFGLFVILCLAVISCPNGDNLIEHTVTFDPDNGDSIFSVKVEDGKKVTIPTEPTKNNYIFRSWFLGDNEFNFNTPITGNITLIAQWEAVGANNRTVTFKNDDVVIDIIQVPVNTKIPAGDVPANPSKDGHDFDGWDFDIDNDDIIEDTTIYALWVIKKFTITFNVDGVETTIDNVEWGTVFNTLNIPTPEKANHNFTGWSPALPEFVTASATYTAQFIIKTYTVTFIIDSVPTVRDNIVHGTAINIIDIPDTNRNGFNFTGWLPALPEFVIADASYTAQYIAIEYITITWNLDGGNWQGAAPPMQIEKGETITRPTNPRKSGYRFLHWTTDPPDTEDPTLFNFDDPITQPITLRAVWEEVNHTVIFNSNGGETSNFTLQVKNNQSINEALDGSEIPEFLRDGFDFVGWSKNSLSCECTTDDDCLPSYTCINGCCILTYHFFDTPITDNLELYAVWKEVDNDRIWWGNFIPTGSTTAAMATNPESRPFILDDLVSLRDEARDFYGTGPNAGNIWGSETKNNAEFANQASVQTTGFAYHYIISPRKLTDITIDGLTAFSSFTEVSRDIDGDNYFIYYLTNPANPVATFNLTLIY